MTVTLRPARSEDDPFLLQVYASTRADEMAMVPWSAEQKEAFVRMQFNAQREAYAIQFPGAEYSVIQSDKVPIGRLILWQTEDRILLVDIALLPEYRNQGIGTAFVRELQNQAAQANKLLLLHVENFSRALRLYERLGFQKVDEIGFYYEMAWHPTA